MVKNKVSLYFHIPFCTKKCPYCHFYVIPNRLSHHKLLSESIALEWQKQLPLLKNKEIVSIYFGGGTPALFGGIEEILKNISRGPDCEITIEANPEEITLDLLTHFRAIGINRLSLGVQSLDDRSLQTLERVHSADKAKEAIHNAKKAGFENVSIDLMYDLPGQTEESFRYTLNQLSALPIHHISLYNLTIEPHTSFYKRQVQTPAPELSLRLLTAAVEKFKELGFERYEISAFALPNHKSLHNLGYWTARPFLGFGPSAFSYWSNKRFRNVANINRYAKQLKENLSAVDFEEELTYPANVKELFAVKIRLKEGANLHEFELPDETLTAIEKLKYLELLKEENFQIQLTERGMLFYDTVAAEII
ncbi:MAG: coproporphyrinogen III oxidase [Chlamydiae bacterium CG10_big_fil_rev_8_21_14_0_10_42_34]|nr:MAG: coproporphyrinogen III oxidase [Chlamydiae bacterium CG10_big_fil_rev_8_21_14_0_10_42_34]